MDLERKYKIFEEQSEVIPKALYCYPFCFYSTKTVCIINDGAVRKSCRSIAEPNRTIVVRLNLVRLDTLYPGINQPCSDIFKFNARCFNVFLQ